LSFVTDTDPSASSPFSDDATAAGAALEPDPGLGTDPTPPRPARPTGPVQYKGEDLDAERGPGLGCFRFQVVVLVALIVLTPLSVVWNWPSVVSAILLFVVILLLLVTGQTIIFLLRIVAADRRGRRRPLASETKTVGELEDEAAGEVEASGEVDAAGVPGPAASGTEAESPSPDEDPTGR
jgi:hypothetical protein